MFEMSTNAARMLRNRAWLAIIVRLMSDEVMAVIYLETDLSLKRRDTEWEMISGIHPAAVQFDLPSFARHLLQLIGHLTCFLLIPPSRFFDVYRLVVL